MQDKTFVQIDDIDAAWRMQAETQLAAITTRGKINSAPCSSGSRDDRRELRRIAGATQRRFQQRSLPGEIRLVSPVLQ